MPKTITIEVEYTIEETGVPISGNAEWLRQALTEYLSHEEYPLRDDYSKDAWGGYDGAYITGARIVKSEVK